MWNTLKTVLVGSLHLRSSYAHFIRHGDSGEESLPNIVWSGETFLEGSYIVLVDNQIIRFHDCSKDFFHVILDF